MTNLRRKPWAIILIALSFGWAQAGSLTTLYTFAGSPTDGSGPTALTIDANGVLYGTTGHGGGTGCDGGCGAIFSLSPPATAGGSWAESVFLLHAGHRHARGTYPGVGVSLGPAGAVYGVTLEGGDQNNGTVFALAATAPGAPAKQEIVHRFNLSDGSFPEDAGVFGSDGVLYGTTTFGGTSHYGTVYSLARPASGGGAWTETVLHSFNFGEAANPYAGVVIDSDGVLYGTTLAGGPEDRGAVFSLSPPTVPGGSWTESILYTFTGGADGGQPRNGTLALGSGGVLYGTTPTGGAHGMGTVFALTPPVSPGGAWTETVLHSFAGPPDDGATPEAGITLGPDEILYSTTFAGGASGNGTVFSLSPPVVPGGDWTETVLYSFTGGNDGAGPWATVVLSNGVLYGSTLRGGALGSGTVFSLIP